ncbi:MAG: hypothetical protein M1830_009055 [Pleopsidium flavum]|nr:MAG: hypothetical protein M1830_009055 [Pleopsidium flavum]
MMEELPSELLIHIAHFLDPLDIVQLQAVSQRLHKITRDNQLWRSLCFDGSQTQATRRRREFSSGGPTMVQEPQAVTLRRAASNLIQSNGGSGGAYGDNSVPASDEPTRHIASNEKMRALANWDPSYPTEKVDWYSEYIARHAPISMSWLQQPTSGRGERREKQEIRGLALFETDQERNAHKVVAPLDDGSVCLWDISKPETTVGNHQGRLISRSKGGLLSVNGPQSQSWQDPAYTKAKMTSTGVVECVSVDSFRRTAYFAVQSGLNEVDLETLQIVSHEQYPFSISALSEVKYSLPLTVGTTLSLHLHDPRIGHNAKTSNHLSEGLDHVATFPASPRSQNDFHRLLSGDPILEPAPLFQPGPLSILHFNPVSDNPCQQGEIFVAGRFPSILNYDRRFFPKLRSTIHSGARLCGLTSLPYPFTSLEMDLMRQNQLSTAAVEELKARPGATLVGCGEYNGKGSLEIYGLCSEPTIDGNLHAGHTLDSTFKNRVSASRSKLLSVATHGTRIVFSDGDGMLKWVERDGSTLVRRWNINQYHQEEVRGLFTTSVLEAGSGDVALKILTPGGNNREKQLNQDDLLIWTGERIGLLNFASKPAFSAVDFEESAESVEEALRRREECIYGQTMRRALERQADEVRFVRGLGFGARGF